MQPKHWYALLLLLLVPGIMFAQSGKIRGTVVDSKSKDPLIGANVVIEGTTMGAVTDVNGEYLIINVPVGDYTLKVSYVSYQTQTVSGIRVNLGLTTERNFELTAGAVDLQAVEIVAERPLVNKNATSSVRIIDQTIMDKMPARGINAAIALQPGLVGSGGTFYIRGSRSDETGWSLEGMGVRDPFTGGNAVSVIAEAVEEIQVMTGGFSAEFGGANAGLIRQQLRSGSEQWRLGAILESDYFAKPGTKALGTHSSGLFDFVGTASGPIMDNVRTFLSGQYRTWQAGGGTWFEGYDFGVFPTFSDYNANHPTAARRDTVRFAAPGGNLTGLAGTNNQFLFAGTVSVDLNTTQLRVGGTYQRYDWKGGLGYYSNLAGWNKDYTGEGYNYNGFVDAKLTQFLSPKTFIEASVSYYNTFATNYDPEFKDNFYLYGDSAAQYKHGVAMRADGSFFNGYTLAIGDAKNISLGFGGPVPPKNGPVNGYGKTDKTQLGAKVDFTSQVTNAIEIKAGGEFSQSTYRSYAPPNLYQWAVYSKRYPGDKARFEQLLAQYSNIVGYDFYGKEIDSDFTMKDSMGRSEVISPAPYQPMFGAGYVQSKIELRDIVMNIGVRYDYINTDVNELIDPSTITFNSQLAVARSSNFQKVKGTGYIQPRFGFSFPVTDRTVFHAQFGKFVGQGSLGSEIASPVAITPILLGQYFYTSTFGFGLKPQKSTQYEIGVQQQVSDFASIDVTAFYKNIIDQIEYRFILPSQQSQANGPIPLQVNGDFSTTKGLEFKFTMRRTNRLQANFNYTLSDAKTTGSSRNGKAAIYGGTVAGVPFIPRYVFPATFDQRHKGNLMLDYRFGRNDGGPVLEQLGLNFLMYFQSGFAYTKLENKWGDTRSIYPLEEVGNSTGPWFLSFDGRLDKTFQVGNLNLNVYVYMNNLFNMKSPTGVNVRTGDPLDNGYLSSVQGKEAVANAGVDSQLYSSIYNFFTNNPAGGGGLVQGPRTIRFGIKVDY